MWSTTRGTTSQTGEHHHDAILDIGGNRRLAHLRRALAPSGRLVLVGGETGGRWWLAGAARQLRAYVLSLFVTQKLGAFISSEKSEDLMVLRDLIKGGKMAPAIERRTR